jgi:hypothetical protein
MRLKKQTQQKKTRSSVVQKTVTHGQTVNQSLKFLRVKESSLVKMSFLIQNSGSPYLLCPPSYSTDQEKEDLTVKVKAAYQTLWKTQLRFYNPLLFSVIALSARYPSLKSKRQDVGVDKKSLKP